MTRYLPLDVLSKRGSTYDCTGNGVSVTSKLYIEHPDGHVTEEDLDNLRAIGERVAVMVIAEKKVGKVYYNIREKDDKRWLMFGGNFAWSGDSRARSLIPYPLPIHDRFEG